MPRPTFLVAEPEPEQALSSRKLLLETFKYNVITAHSELEMFDLLKQFPRVNAVILHGGIPGAPTERLVQIVKNSHDNIRVIVLSPDGDHAPGADHVVSSHNPEELLQLLQSIFGDPRKLVDGTAFPMTDS